MDFKFERLSDSQKRIEVEKFCKNLESVCKSFGMQIRKKTESGRSESRYYVLFKKERECTIRVSCHRSSSDRKRDFDFVITHRSLNNFQSEMDEVLLFFNIRRIAPRTE
ncbi:MAG: hypothetical protein WDN09_01255 [bacterium]